MAKRRTKGVLTSLGKAPKSKPKKKKRESPVRKVGRWLGTAVILAVMLVAVVLLGVRLFTPHLGEQQLEGDFEVMEIMDDTSLYREEAGEVSAAVFEIDNKMVAVPLNEEQNETVEPGTRVHVRYTKYPVIGQIRVEEWSLVEE
jgi:hypothetical protein